MNFVARKHPVNVLRRDQFLAELIAEFKPKTVVGRRNCEHLAGIYEQLEALKPGSTEWNRLVQASQTLSGTLKESESSEAQRPEETPTREQIIVRLERLLAVLRRETDAEIEASAQRNAELQYPVVPIPIAADPVAAPPAAPQPQLPDGVTEGDVRECLRGCDDETQRNYQSGRLSKADAYEMTRCWLKHKEEMR